MRISSVIFGCSGLQLTDEERDFFKQVNPWGFILFGRNIDTPQQVRVLVSDLKASVSHNDVPVFIDQEGGRVRRLRPPHWPDYPAGKALGQTYEQEPEKGKRFAWLQSRLMACDLEKLGINADCLPVLDVPVKGSHDVIGDRAYSYDLETVIEVGRAATQGLIDGGVLPVIKHIPGHGRAMADSHKELPVVDTPLEELEKSDFVPFKELSDVCMAMTAHVVYSAIDSESPATTSQTVIEQIIRGFMGFDGLLMCDDLSMHALSGDFSERTQSAFAAGCDIVLHCNGNMQEMKEIASAVPDLNGKALERAVEATRFLHMGQPCEEHELRREFKDYCSQVPDADDPTNY